MSNQITIGGRIVSVPAGYVQAEADYCKEELEAFHMLNAGRPKETMRRTILEKRIEFYDRYCAGHEKIKPRPTIQRKWWQRFAASLLDDSRKK